MLAGVGGVDIALLVVAADEGVMPQTREHLDIVGLVGVDRVVVALTKVDLVGDEEALARAEGGRREPPRRRKAAWLPHMSATRASEARGVSVARPAFSVVFVSVVAALSIVIGFGPRASALLPMMASAIVSASTSAASPGSLTSSFVCMAALAC